MTDPAQPDKSPDKANTGEDAAPSPAADGAAVPGKKLTPEEQMALYEEHLKETDWGHQPC